MTLADATINTPYTIGTLDTQDEELENFLLTLGIYQGEQITLVSTGKKNMTVVVRDGRYTIDQNLAGAITLQ